MNAFWFHFNRPETQRQGRPVMTVHYKGACHFVRHIACEVPLTTRERNSQPHVVMAGKGAIEFSNDTAYIRAASPSTSHKGQSNVNDNKHPDR
jgi:hypothetical protein